jgi:hypothetical protein
MPFTLAAIGLAIASCAPQPPAPRSESVLTGTGFKGRIQPLFLSFCIDCHRGPNAPRELELDSYEHILRGSTNGPVVVPGDPDQSRLVEMVRYGFMPLGKPRLQPADVQAIMDWIAAGAPNS